jgi:hypothetical protein
MRTVSTEEARAVLIERAQYWFRLAKEQDESTDVAESIPLQPKDDNNKE